MKIEKIKLEPSINEIENNLNAKIRVIVEMDDKRKYIIDICTPLYYMSYMKHNMISFIPESELCAVVKKITYENILNMLETYCEDDAYWLKFYNFMKRSDGDIAIDEINKIICNHNIENKRYRGL